MKYSTTSTYTLKYHDSNAPIPIRRFRLVKCMPATGVSFVLENEMCDNLILVGLFGQGVKTSYKPRSCLYL